MRYKSILPIKEIALLKSNPKEYYKTHDGTNLYTSSNAKDCFEDFSKYAQKDKIGILSQKEALNELGSYRQHMKDKGVFDEARKAGMRLIIEKTDRYDENRYFREKIRRGP